MTILIKNSSGLPIYEQIKEQIKEAIMNDELSEGDALPSIRQLAADLKVSVITTTRAYTELEQEGFATNVQGKGCYVAPKDSALIREQLLRKIESNFETAIHTARVAKISKDELEKILRFMMGGIENG